MNSINPKFRLTLPLIATLLLIASYSQATAGTQSEKRSLLTTATLISSTLPTITSTHISTGIITTTATITTTPTATATPMATSTPTVTTTPHPTFTPTLSPTPSATPPQVITRTATITATITPTPLVEAETLTQNSDLDLGHIYLPLIRAQEPQPFIPPEMELYCSGPNQPVPDNNPGGLSSAIQISDPRIIADLNIYLKVDHSYIGDLKTSLTHMESGKMITLFDRPGYPGNPCSKDDIRAIFDDEMTWHVETKCATYPAAISGSFESDGLLSSFDGETIGGEWTLNVSDLASNNSGTLREWCLVAQVSENPPPPTPTPLIPPLPDQKIISGVNGKGQQLPLDCESRSAVDWANYFGKHIDELTFFHQLPHSDNPDKGFVGPVNGAWGQIPPNPYGVHAEPVAEVLRDYGLPAVARRSLSWDELRAEVAAGRPVIVWIIGSISLKGSLMNGAPVYYTPADGQHTVVAQYEHTVVVTGYTSSYVYYLNGSRIYQINSDKFLDSWSALGNMAITWSP